MKIRDTMETFHARMGMIKVRNGKNLTEVEEIKGGKIHRRTVKKKKWFLMIQIDTMLWSLT